MNPGRVHIGIAFGSGKERAALVAVEHIELAPPLPTGPFGKLMHIVGEARRYDNQIEVLRDEVVGLARDLQQTDICFFVDVTTGPGAALAKILYGWPEWPEGRVHRPHGYSQRGIARQGLLTSILKAYGNSALEFESAAETSLVKALSSYHAMVGEDGRVTAKGDAEPLVVALGLAMSYPLHSGPGSAPPRYRERTGDLSANRIVSGDVYLGNPSQ